MFWQIKLAAMALVAVAVLSLGWVAKHEYDASHALAAQVAAQELRIATITADAQRAQDALAAAAASAAARAAQSATIRKAVYAADPSAACVRSPVIAALGAGLRQPADRAGTPPAAGRAPVLPARAAVSGGAK